MTTRRRFIETSMHAVGAVCGFIAGGRLTQRKVYRDTWRCKCGAMAAFPGGQGHCIVQDSNGMVTELHQASFCMIRHGVNDREYILERAAAR